ncbi:MAG: tRNA (guanosine(37)-N1)-methyltransferase TrmD [Firmicutes bacterium]|nr:tRNA (guanosine(37)-N1)-methyltransferase TrmD [Bacillota bacterium]
MKISILTVRPEMFHDFLESHVIARAKQLGAATVEIVDMRDFVKGSFRAVDDSPYGGGRGMILRCEPVLKALEAVRGEGAEGSERNGFGVLTAALTPAGDRFTQKMAHELAELSHLILICGQYEGFDERIFSRIDREISLGDFVMTGGEIGAMAVTDAVVRLLKGVLKEGSAEEESFENGLLEYPQYTRPAVYEGMAVPEVLLSGNHEAIAAWRKEAALAKTKERRPDLMENTIE